VSRRRLYPYLFLALLAPVPVRAASEFGSTFLPLETTARGAALAGTNVALASGSEAVCTNPAGLLSLKSREVSFSYSDLFGLGLVSHTVAQFGWPQFRHETRWTNGRIEDVKLPPPALRAFGLAATTLGADLGEDSYHETQVALAYAWHLPAGMQAGASYRFLTASSTIAKVAAHGHAADLGLQRPLGPLRLGFSAVNLLSSVNWDQGLDDVLEKRWALGLAYAPTWAPLQLTLEDKWTGSGWTWLQAGAGAEWRAVGPLTLRAGVRRRRDALPDARTEWGAGAGLVVGGFRFDYGMQSNDRGLDGTQRFSAAVAL
jgi:hypothetical protein